MEIPQNASRVFVVDDDPMLVWTVAEILRGAGFDAISFTSPVEALSAAQSHHPGLLLSAVIMRQLTGIELANRVLELCPTCKILLLSGHPDAFELLRDAEKSGRTFEVIAKPARPELLVQSVRRALLAANRGRPETASPGV